MSARARACRRSMATGRGPRRAPRKPRDRRSAAVHAGVERRDRCDAERGVRVGSVRRSLHGLRVAPVRGPALPEVAYPVPLLLVTILAVVRQHLGLPFVRNGRLHRAIAANRLSIGYPSELISAAGGGQKQGQHSWLLSRCARPAGSGAPQPPQPLPRPRTRSRPTAHIPGPTASPLNPPGSPACGRDAVLSPLLSAGSCAAVSGGFGRG